MQPINKKLLVHNVIVKQQTGVDRNRNAIYKEVVLTNVRISASFAQNVNGYGYVQADSLTMYVDTVNSVSYTHTGDLCAWFELKEKDVVVWNNKEYTVKSITQCFADGKEVHHLEVALV